MVLCAGEWDRADDARAEGFTLGQEMQFRACTTAPANGMTIAWEVVSFCADV